MMTRYKRPDVKKALSLLESAERDMMFTLSLEINEKSASTIVRNIYECFRMVGEASLVSRGIESKDHILPISELINFQVDTKRPLNLLDSLRKTRHNINYYGYQPSIAEVEDVISLATSCFETVITVVRNSLKSTDRSADEIISEVKKNRYIVDKEMEERQKRFKNI